MSATFTFSAERAAQAAAGTGKTLPPPPPGLDGSQVRLVAGPGVAQVWSSSAGMPPSSSGVAFPFLSAAPLTAIYLAWAAVWVAMVWGLAAASFLRKDL